MSLEDLTGGDKFIDDLVNTNPASGDPKSEGDDHLRGVKNALLNSLSNVAGAVTSTHTELNLLDGVTATTAELNILDGVTSDATEINLLDGVTAFLDEDDMASDSATSFASQQSLKAYSDGLRDWTVVATADSPVTAALGKNYYCDLSGGAIEIDLPSVGAGDDGKDIGIKVDENAATNNLTIDPADTDTVGGEASIEVDKAFFESRLVYDHTNTNWGL